MSYVDRHLNPGEKVVHLTTIHPIIFLIGVLIGVTGVALFWTDVAALGGFIVVLALVVLAASALRYQNSEFAVTSRRVIIKIGWLSTHTLELQLSKVEALSVDQDAIGQLFDYGTLVVGGTGGTKEAFNLIRAPMAFRQAVQQQTDLASRPVARSPEGPNALATEIREERECPHCAERILVKASRCRFCGQAVTPVVE